MVSKCIMTAKKCLIIIPPRKCSIMAPAKWRNTGYVLTEIFHQRSKWLDPRIQMLAGNSLKMCVGAGFEISSTLERSFTISVRKKKCYSIFPDSHFYSFSPCNSLVGWMPCWRYYDNGLQVILLQRRKSFGS